MSENSENQNAGIVFNVTVKVDRNIADEWLRWMQQEYIPAMMNTECFTGFKIVRLLEVDDTEGPTYAIQYDARSKADYNRYVTLHDNTLQKRAFDKWGNRFIAFRSLMQIVG